MQAMHIDHATEKHELHMPLLLADALLFVNTDADMQVGSYTCMNPLVFKRFILPVKAALGVSKAFLTPG